MSAAGALLFARYAYPPNALGYCGPDGADAMLRPDATADIERRARGFEGAWSYLEFIAESVGGTDPLDERVVEAYWLGNELLDDLDPGALVRRLQERFRGQLRGTWREAAQRAAAHHSFQVFEVYPWAGLLHAPGAATAVTVLEACRIRTGRVVAVQGEEATVESRPLTWDGTALGRGDHRTETVRWSVDGSAFLDGIEPGATVALHWDWLCDVLTDEQAARVETHEDHCLGGLGLSPAVR